jgi:hypothetical protein
MFYSFHIAQSKPEEKLFHNPLLLRSAARTASCVLGAKTSSTALQGRLRAFLSSILAGSPFARSRDETGYETASRHHPPLSTGEDIHIQFLFQVIEKTAT